MPDLTHVKDQLAQAIIANLGAARDPLAADGVDANRAERQNQARSAGVPPKYFGDVPEPAPDYDEFGQDVPDDEGDNEVQKHGAAFRAMLEGIDQFSEEEPTEILKLPAVRQPNTFSCGASAAFSVGSYFHVGPPEVSQWEKALGTSKKASTDPGRIAKYLGELGLEVSIRGCMSLDDLREVIASGRPVICPIKEYSVPGKETSEKYGHFVTVVGLGMGMVFVNDPSIGNILAGEDADQVPGLMPISEAKWMEVWHDNIVGKEYDHFGIIVGPPPGKS